MRRVSTYRQKRSVDGKRLCLVCETPCPGRRRSYCSDECFLRNTPTLMRLKVFNRDKGVCASCSMQCSNRDDLQTSLVNRLMLDYRATEDTHIRELLGATRRQIESTPGKVFAVTAWHMDHIVPVAEGGGLCGLDNLRTLCVVCHKAETAKLRKRLKRSQR
jgi:5-methylcytosine-specific restriction endonuclease McrA